MAWYVSRRQAARPWMPVGGQLTDAGRRIAPDDCAAEEGAGTFPDVKYRFFALVPALRPALVDVLPDRRIIPRCHGDVFDDGPLRLAVGAALRVPTRALSIRSVRTGGYHLRFLPENQPESGANSPPALVMSDDADVW
ncbi:hypothetical protein KCP69_00715 [Salmonella enterica subsp. enterica]|nr:hypothetical protein KCP69_00715 [Salmonella enterica subsp. enterica]